MEKLTQFGLVY